MSRLQRLTDALEIMLIHLNIHLNALYSLLHTRAWTLQREIKTIHWNRC